MKSKDFPLIVKKGNSTVKIYHSVNGGYDEFKVAFYVQGKRKLETCADLKKAKRRAEEINHSVNRGEIESINLTTTERVAYTEACCALEKCGVPVHIAAREYAAAVQILGNVTLLEAAKYYVAKHPSYIIKKSFDEILFEYLRFKKDKGVATQSIKHIACTLRTFGKAFQCDLAAISAEQIRQHLLVGEKGALTFNAYLSRISEFFKFARRQRYLPQDWNETDLIDRRVIPDREIEIYSPDQIRSILEGCDVGEISYPRLIRGKIYARKFPKSGYEARKNLKAVLALWAFAGIRIQEICRMNWEQIGVADGKFIEVKAAGAKTRKRRLIPFHENLRAWLVPIRKTSGPIWPLGIGSAKAHIQDLCKRIGFKWKRNALRHSYISYRVAVTSDVAMVSLEAGNSPQKIFRNYLHFVTPEDGKKWFGVMPTTPPNNIVHFDAAVKAQGETETGMAKAALN